MTAPLRLGPVTGVALRGTGAAFPSDLERRNVPGRVTNDEAYRLLIGDGWREQLAARGHDPEHVARTHGIAAREWSSVPGHRPAASSIDLAALAGRRALDDAGLDGRELDAIVAATSTPTQITASFAAKVGARLGSAAACFDLRAGGAGSLYGWIDAAALIAAGARRVLVIGADTPSHYVDPTQVGQALVYGDGAGALVLEADANAPGGLVRAELGRRDLPGRPFTVDAELPPRGLDGPTFTYPDRVYTDALQGTWRDAAARLAELGREVEAPATDLLPYAVTRAQVELVADALPAARLHSSLRERACLGAAGIAVALHDARSGGHLREGATLGLVAVAGGACVGLALWSLG